MGTTVTQLLARIRDDLDEVTTTNGQWDNPQLRRWINQGLDDIARDTKALRATTTFTSVAGTAEYTMAANILRIDYAYWTEGTLKYPLTPVHYDGADMMWGNDQNRQSYRPSMFTVWGFPPQLKMKLYPVPSSVNVVSLMVARTATKIDETGADDGNVLDFPEAWSDVLSFYVQYRAQRKDRQPEWQDTFNMFGQGKEAIKDNEYIIANRNVVMDPAVLGGVPAYIADWNYRG